MSAKKAKRKAGSKVGGKADSKARLVDAVVIGAGFAGSTTALLMKRAGITPVVLEPRAIPTRQQDIVDIRATALNRTTMGIFDKIGIFSEISSKAAEVAGISVCEANISSGNLGPNIDYIAQELIGDSFGCVVLNCNILASLGRALSKSGLEVISTRAEKLDLGDDQSLAQVSLADGSVLKTPLLVGADGRMSWTRSQAGISTFKRDYHQSALVSVIELDAPHANLAYEHFTPAGPFALVPLPGNFGGLIWCDSPSRIDFLSHCDASTFARHLGARLRAVSSGRFGLKGTKGRRLAFPLGLLHARSYFRGRAVLVGDAAHVIHPIAGLGLNLGMRDCAGLVKALSRAKSIGQDLGSQGLLSAYQKSRRFDVIKHIAITDSFDFLFCRHGNNPLVKTLRRSGFGVVASSRFVRQQLARQASYG